MSDIAGTSSEDICPVFITYPTIYSLLMLNYLVYKRNIKFVGIILSASHIKRRAKNFSLTKSFFILMKKSGLAYALYMLFIIKCKYLMMFIWNIVSRIKGKSLNLKTFRGIAKEQKIPFVKSKNINNKKTFDFMRSVGTNLIVSAYNNQIIRYRIAKLFTYKGINIHNSYLPDFAGLDAAFESLYRRVCESGATIHYVDKNIDTGEIIIQEKFPIYPEDSVFSLNIRQWLRGVEMLPNVMVALKEKRIQTKKQDLSKVKYPYRSFPGRKRVKLFLKRRKKHLITLRDIFFPNTYVYQLFSN
jgi:methionyl-tRNA formyltransferase